MPRPHHPLRLPAAALATGMAAWGMVAPALAELRLGSLPPLRLGAELAAGLEYDSNVSVEEVDASSNLSDYALTIDAGLKAEQPLSERAEVGITYDYSQSLYQEFSQVDRQTHILGSDFSWRFDALDSDMSVFYIHSRLDGNKFLELYRASPALSGFLAKKWFLRGAYVYQDKAIEERPLRDAVTHSGEADLYHFIRGLRSYVNLGYRYRDENAEARQLDYRSHGVKLRYVQRVPVFSRLAKLELSYRFEDRDYVSITPSIGEERADKRHRLRADLEIPLTEQGALQLYVGYADYDSNLERVDYDQTIIGTRFIYRW